MDPAIWGFIGTVVGAVVGASASIFTTFITARNSAHLQENADTLQRLERAREFQRTNLLELQEALSQEMRLIGRAHLEDLESFRKSENDGRSNLLSEELNQELMLSRRKVAILTERVSDDILRDNLKALRQNMSNVLMAKSENESRIMIKEAGNSFEQFMQQLGLVLRINY